MTGRTPAEAVNMFQEAAQQAVSCVSKGVVTVDGGYYVAPNPHTLSLGQRYAEPLPGDIQLSLSLAVNYRIIKVDDANSGWQIAVTTYFYKFINTHGQEVLAFHWHPDSRSHVKHPHIHLGAGAKVGFETLANAHIPTGWITLPDVIQMAIAELNVTPCRDDWEVILDAARQVESGFAAS